MTDDEELATMLDWLHTLGLPEAEFRVQVRPYFDDTESMVAYLEAPEITPTKGKHRRR